jgi:hypothetical protein
MATKKRRSNAPGTETSPKAAVALSAEQQARLDECTRKYESRLVGPVGEPKEDWFPTSSELRSNLLEYHRAQINSDARFKARLESVRGEVLKASKSGKARIVIGGDLGDSIKFYLEAHGCKVKENCNNNEFEPDTRIEW